MRLSSLVCGILCINKRVTYITNQVLTSKHDCVFDLFQFNLRLPKRLAHCKSFTQSCRKHSLCDYFSTRTLYCSKKVHRVFKQSQCSCKLRIKDTPASLKSHCVNKISEFTFYPVRKPKTKLKLQNFYAFNRGGNDLIWITKTPHSAN
jgi:hypothetical protein